jgi:hypothetical protein
VKGRAIAIATVFNWGTNLIVTFTFLDVMSKLKKVMLKKTTIRKCHVITC